MDQFLFAFLGGVLSFISPCVLPLVPGYISFISGVSVEKLVDRDKPTAIVPGVLVSSLLFVAGFSLVFILLGASATFLGQMLSSHMGLFRKAAGVLLIVFGLHTMGVFRIRFLSYEKRISLKTGELQHAKAFLLGIVFAFGWTPCIGPILAGILAMAGTQESLRIGILLLLVYAMGLGIPFILTGLATGWFLGIFERLKRHFKAVEIVSGMLLVTIGVLVLWNRLGILSGLIMKWFPFLARVG